MTDELKFIQSISITIHSLTLTAKKEVGECYAIPADRLSLQLYQQLLVCILHGTTLENIITRSPQSSIFDSALSNMKIISAIISESRRSKIPPPKKTSNSDNSLQLIIPMTLLTSVIISVRKGKVKVNVN